MNESIRKSNKSRVKENEKGNEWNESCMTGGGRGTEWNLHSLYDVRVPEPESEKRDGYYKKRFCRRTEEGYGGNPENNESTVEGSLQKELLRQILILRGKDWGS